MARRSHQKPEEDTVECISYRMRLDMPLKMRRFLQLEGKRLTSLKIRRGVKGLGYRKIEVTPQDIVRALVTAYYEKRLIGLLVDPDD